MPTIFFVAGLPFALAAAVCVMPSAVRRWPAIAGWSSAACYWAAAAALLPVVASGETLAWTAAWVPQLGFDLALRVTPFSAWFGFLIFAVGGGITLYACSYFSGNDRLPFLLACLLLFTAAMLGVVWADNFYLLFLAWEATSLLSFLLVGFGHENGSTRAKASQALLVTFSGGAAMLAGLVLVGVASGETTLSGLLASGVPEGGQATVAILLIAAGALTKSAQFPFHFWLPNAMAGPTPVSAFLHSATMVKAGVYLLAVLAPVFRDHAVWTPLLVASGLLTVACAVARARRDDDFKSVLASTTLAALGFLTVLAGIGTGAALLAFPVYLTAHALYKAPLFLSAGNLEKRFGTRSLSRLQGAGYGAGLTGGVVLLSAASLLGVPPFPGFLGKEYLLKAAWGEAPVLAGAVALAATGSLYLGARLLLPLFIRGKGVSPVGGVPVPMAAATAVPAALSVAAIAGFGFVSSSFLAPAATSLGAGEGAGYRLWYGVTPELCLGLGALGVACAWGWATRRRPPVPGRTPVTESIYDAAVRALRTAGAATARLLGTGALNVHVAIVLAAAGALSLASLGLPHWPTLSGSLDAGSEHSAVFVLLAPLLAVSAVTSAVSRHPLTVLVALGIVGLFVAFLFLWFSAPDLALTQLLAETLVVFLLAGLLARFKELPRQPAGGTWRFVVSAAGGLLVSMLVLKAMALEWDRPVSAYYLEQSKPAAFGANVVNVILVDFRALDTLGEIVVLAIAAMGANAALGAVHPNRAPLPGGGPTPWLRSGLPVVMCFLLPTALWVFWRGHNAPGGGFIAALLAAVAVGLGLLARSPWLTPRVMRRLSKHLLAAGLATATASSLVPLFFGKPFFTGLWLHSESLHLGTPLLFDLGVFLTVAGFATTYLRHFHTPE